MPEFFFLSFSAGQLPLPVFFSVDELAFSGVTCCASTFSSLLISEIIACNYISHDKTRIPADTRLKPLRLLCLRALRGGL